MRMWRLVVAGVLLLSPNLLSPNAVRAGAGGGSGTSTGPTLRAMTFNVRYGLAEDGPNRWELRRDLLFKAIDEQDPDVLGVQEALGFQVNEIGAACPRFTVIGVGRDDGESGGELSALLVRTARFIVAESGTFWLSEAPEVAGSKSWDAAFPRICTWARLIDRESGEGIYVYNTHLDHASQAAREHGAALIVERIAGRAHDDPAILMGDFNAGEDNPAIATLLGSADPRGRLVATYRVVHPAGEDPDETVGTFTGFDPAKTHGEKIDHIFATPGLRVIGASIPRPRSADGTRAASDHDPVVAVFRWG